MTRSNIFQTPYARVSGGIVRGAVRRRIVSPVEAIESSYTRNSENPTEVQELLTPNGNVEQQDIPNQSNLNAQERMMILNLKQISDEQRKQVTVLSSSVQLALELTRTIPEFVDWSYIKHKMLAIARNLILGFQKSSSIYPEYDAIRDEVLLAFNASITDDLNIKLFQKHWGSQTDKKMGLQKPILCYLRDYRAKITGKLRTELYDQLGIPKPKNRCGRGDEFEVWLLKLKDLKDSDVWRMNEDDPFGSVAVHAAIALVMKGSHFDPFEPVEVSIEQAGFFFHVLELAVEGRSLDPGNQMWHYRQMKMMEQAIIHSTGQMQKILVVEKDGMEENAIDENAVE